MTLSIDRIMGNADPLELAKLLRRDGAVIVHDALTSSQLAGLNAELDDTVNATSPGLRHPSAERMIEFYGSSTIRLDGMPARSAAFREVMLSPLLCGVADELLLPNCDKTPSVEFLHKPLIMPFFVDQELSFNEGRDTYFERWDEKKQKHCEFSSTVYMRQGDEKRRVGEFQFHKGSRKELKFRFYKEFLMNY